MVNGCKVPLSMYCVGRGKDGEMQTSTKPHNAALMTEALAELLITKSNHTGRHAEVCEPSRMKAAHATIHLWTS